MKRHLWNDRLHSTLLQSRWTRFLSLACLLSTYSVDLESASAAPAPPAAASSPTESTNPPPQESASERKPLRGTSATETRDLLLEESPTTEREGEAQRPKTRFERGKNAYLYGDYLLTIESLTPLLEPELKLSEPSIVIEAYSYLGLAHFYLNNQALARRSFTALIFFQPEHQLDPVQVPPEAVSFFNTIRESLTEELVARQALLQGRGAQKESVALRETILERQVNSPLVAVLPFGVGQFQNGDTFSGQVFLLTELLTAGLSAGFFWYIESKRDRDGRFPREELSGLKQAQQAQLLTGGLSLGLMLVGAAHALLTFQPQLLLKRTTRNQSLESSVGRLQFSSDQLGLSWSF